MKILPLIVFFVLTASFFSTNARAEDTPLADKPAAKVECSCCAADKDGKIYCTGKACCCTGDEKSKPVEKVMRKPSYNRKS